MDKTNHFRTRYADARAHFLELCDHTAARVDSIEHPAKGPDGGAIFTDVATWGADRGVPLVIVSSGTHGIEGYAGSGVQCTLLAEGVHDAFPGQLTMVHAVNPYGFAWQRRVNEDNVDLNRNFSAPLPSRPPPRPGSALPENAGYDELAQLLEPDSWTSSTPAVIQSGLADFARRNGQRAMQAALTAGQYKHPHGFFYGGRKPAWSHRNMLSLASERWCDAAGVVMIDIHTALGEFGAGECIVEYPRESVVYEQCREMWGERVRSTIEGESTSVDVSGSMISGIARSIGRPFIGTGLEFGTVPTHEVLMALLADQYLHRHGELDSAQGRAIKAEMMRVFCPDSDVWRNSITGIAREVVSRALRKPSL